jgi:hypothetical protein
MDLCVCGCGGGACIPQRKYERQRTDPLSQQQLEEVIRFSVNGTCGYPLEDALKKQSIGLDGRDEKMFGGYSCNSISIRLEVRSAASARSSNGADTYPQWLPYRRWTKQVSANCRASSYGH